MNNTSILMNIKQLSEEIGLAVKTIRSTLVNNPTALPPRLVIEGQKALRWVRSEVHEFYGAQKKSHGSNPEFSTQHQDQAKVEITETKKKRGAPRMAERMAKQKLSESRHI